MKDKQVELPEQDIKDLKNWAAENKTIIPAKIQSSIESLCYLYDYTKQKELERKNTVCRLKEAMGIAPKSEKGSSEKSSGKSPKEKSKYQFRGGANRLAKLRSDWHTRTIWDLKLVLTKKRVQG